MYNIKTKQTNTQYNNKVFKYTKQLLNVKIYNTLIQCIKTNIT